MTSQQDQKIKEFENKVRKRSENAETCWKESSSRESRGVLFAEVDGVTLMVYPNGLISIPAVRTYHPPKYPTPVVAAASAKELWVGQKARDDASPRSAKIRRTGHLSPIVEPDLKCRNKVCLCQSETPEVRQQRSQGGFNTNRNRCS